LVWSSLFLQFVCCVVFFLLILVVVGGGGGGGEGRIEVFEKEVLRRMFGPTTEEELG